MKSTTIPENILIIEDEKDTSDRIKAALVKEFGDKCTIYQWWMWRILKAEELLEVLKLKPIILTDHHLDEKSEFQYDGNTIIKEWSTWIEVLIYIASIMNGDPDIWKEYKEWSYEERENFSLNLPELLWCYIIAISSVFTTNPRHEDYDATYNTLGIPVEDRTGKWYYHDLLRATTNRIRALLELPKSQST